MKTKRVVVGTMAAALLSLSVCSLSSVFAATEGTVQITAGNATAKAGEEFTVDVSLSDIPTTGLAACDFAIKYDSTVLTVTSVEAGSLLNIEGDTTSSLLPLFDSEIMASEGIVNVMWSTALDSTYWLKDDGVFCTITGTVADTAAAGVSEIEIVAIERDAVPGEGVANTSIGVGCFADDGSAVRYTASVANGSVTITEDTTAGGDGNYLAGDADCSGTVDVNDVVMAMCYSIDAANNPISAQGLINADVYQTGDGVNSSDAFSIQKKLVNLLSDLPES